MTAARRWWVPEVVQSSDTDCGPACLASLLGGFGVELPYDQVRDACHTDVDGTSIDDLEDAARGFGVDVAQVLVPPEHVTTDPSVLPAVAVLALPGGIAHFVVLWRRFGPWFQVMDPMVGRRWMHARHLHELLYLHRTTFDAATWRAWAGGEAPIERLGARLRALGVPRPAEAALLREATDDPDWTSLACLDALVRLVEEVDRRGSRPDRREAVRLLTSLAGRSALPDQRSWLPERFFSARPDPADPEQLTLSAAVLLVGSGRDAEARAEGPPRVGVARRLAAVVQADGAARVAPFAVAAGLAGAALVFEGLLLDGVLEVGALFPTPGARGAAVLAVAAFALIALLLDLHTAAGLRALGRRLEARVRMGFLDALARLPDRWFAQRLTSDLTLRVHSVVQLRGVPGTAGSLLRALSALTITAAGLGWIDPRGAPPAALAVVAGVGLPLLLQPRLAELQLAAATYQGGLSRYLLDALRGALPVRAHGAQRSLVAGHDALLDRWAALRRESVRAAVVADGLIHGVGALATGLILVTVGSSDASSVLLWMYWSSQLPVLGRDLSRAVFDYPALRAVGARLFEAIGAPRPEPGRRLPVGPGGGLGVRFRGVTLRVGRTLVLDGVDFELEPGCHCALAGRSGAGKSSVLGVLLGWHAPEGGRVELDGVDLRDLDPDSLAGRVAWVDPQIHLWNRSLAENLVYGLDGPPTELESALVASELAPVVDRLPQGLSTPVGDAGSALSQGEAQRVRLARAMLRRDARLVVLDEPFRGLDRAARRRLSARVRAWWPRATLLCVTHDLSDTLDFDRVLVFEAGRLIESGHPRMLARQSASAYAHMLDAEREVRAFFDAPSGWTRWEVGQGGVRVEVPPPSLRAEPTDVAGAR